MFKKLGAAAIIAAVAVVATPLAAQALVMPEYLDTGTEIYVNTPTTEPGATVIVTIVPGSFDFSGSTPEDVNFTLTGENASGATLATLQAVDSKSYVKQATSSGGGSLSVTLPLNSSGSYQVTAVGVSSGNIGTASFSVVPADTVAHTGSEFPMLVVWIAGGALALGVALILVLRISRRQRAAA